MNTSLLRHDYQGQDVVFTGDGWFNATQVARRFDKDPTSWLRQRDTVAYISALSEANGNSVSETELNKIMELDSRSSLSKAQLLVFVKKTGLARTRAGAPETGGGTWLHPDLGVVFARWLDIHFAIWCDRQIKRIIQASTAPPDIMRLLLADTATEWELRFPASFYQALARVTRTTYSGHRHGTPHVFGKITLQWIYSEILPKEVLAEIKTRKGDSEKMHQWLTNGGSQLLDRQISKIQAIAESSVDFRDFDARCMQASRVAGQLKLVYP